MTWLTEVDHRGPIRGSPRLLSVPCWRTTLMSICKGHRMNLRSREKTYRLSLNERLFLGTETHIDIDTV